MEAVYGRKRRAAGAGESETWMDGFVRLNPEGGIRACVERVWNRNTSTSDERQAVLAAAMAPLFEVSARTSLMVR